MSVLNLQNLSNTNPLVILDMANNHNGSLVHGKQIIDEIHSLKIPKGIQIAIKFQYRNLPDFIHPDFRNRTDLRYVDRFLSTRLEWDEFYELLSHIKTAGFLSACTPFDEHSISKVIEHGFDLLKIASASFTDWSLLEATKDWTGPIVASTAGASLSDIDRVVTFFKNRKKDFALMHCVASYPTKNDELLLNRISAIKTRYKDIPVGYSTHEDPSNFIAGPMALAAGGVILERHFGSTADGGSLNKYSSDKVLLQHWLDSVWEATQMLGPARLITSNNSSEKASLDALRRYAFASKDFKPGDVLTSNDVFFAIPGSENQYQANDFGKYTSFSVNDVIEKGSPINRIQATPSGYEARIFNIREQVLKMITVNGVTIPNNALLEISHHYGIENFDKFGTCMITVVNREYCKKLIFLLPGQTHPGMYHKKKDETFFLLAGDLDLKLDGVSTQIGVGDTVAILPGVIHEFSSKSGAIVEEVSSSHMADDSFYVDDKINSNNNRKTYLQYWLESEE